ARAEHEIYGLRDGTLHADITARRAQVAITAGNPEEAARLAKLALDDLPLAVLYSRIVPNSVQGDLLHCKGVLSLSLAL
ncbi:hypothetical protein ACQWE9_26015, partial [Salmonella enterica subsp. enterica serovar Infantis]